MGRKVIAFWLSLTMVLSFIVVLDVIVDLTPPVKGGIIRYVNETGTGGAFPKIQDAINASNDGDTVFVYNGTYYENVVVNRSINLTGEDKDNTRINGSGNGDVINMTANWVNITGFTITNSGNDWPDSILKLNSVQNCTVVNNSIIDIYATKLNIGIYLKSSANNTIIENYVSGNFYGILLRWSSNNSIMFNNLSLNSMVGLAIENSSNKNTIAGNYISSSYWDGIHIWSSSNNTVINNTVSGINYDGIDLALTSNNTIIDNNISNCWYSIEIYSSSNNKIKGNNISSGYGYGITLGFSSDNNITDNNFLNDGITIFGDQLSHFNSHDIPTNNVVNGKSLYYYKNCSGFNIDGISLGQLILANCTDIEVRNLKINNTDLGIELGYSTNILLTNNNVTSSDRFGIFLNLASNNNIRSNNVTSKNDYGIYLRSSSNNNITRNNVLNNSFGFWLNLSSNNRIYHNNIVNNWVQAWDDRSDNYWNNSYPSGGNFWSDYIGFDEFKGPDQDIPGNDGIGDTNYTIDSDSKDNYPLMSPIHDCIFLYQGWNLISIPFIQSDTDVDVVLSSIEGSYDSIQWYNINDSFDHWKHNSTKKPSNLNDLDNLDHTMGFWIHITEPDGVLLKYPGIKPTSNQTLTLHPGWNLVGSPSLKSYNRTEGLNNLTFDTHVDAIWTYNAATQKWKELGPTDYFEIGKGYWIHTKTKCEWEVPL